MRSLSRFANRRRLALAAIALAILVSSLTGIASRRAIEAVPPSASEHAERAGLKVAVKALLQANDFAALEHMAMDLRAGGDRTPAGVWKLTVFYAALHEEAAAIDARDTVGWRRLQGKLLDWQRKFPSSPTALVAEAIVRKAEAWAHRPRLLVQEAAYGRPDQAYVGTLESARDKLDSRRAIASLDPHFYVVRADLGTALSEPADIIMDLVHEGLSKTPGYFPIAFSGLDYFLSNSDDDAAARRMEAFANTALAGSDAADGKGLYTRLYWHAFSAAFGNDLFRKTQLNWPKMRDGMMDVLDRFPDAWNRNNFAYLACLQGDKSTTADLIVGIGGKPMLDVWKAKSIFEGCRRWSLQPAATGR